MVATDDEDEAEDWEAQHEAVSEKAALMRWW